MKGVQFRLVAGLAALFLCAFTIGARIGTQAQVREARSEFTLLQIEPIAGFIRALNTLQDIDVARGELGKIIANRSEPRREQDTHLKASYEETGDALDVLDQDGIAPAAVTHLVAARTHVVRAQHATTAPQRRAQVGLAIAKLVQARNAVATAAP